MDKIKNKQKLLLIILLLIAGCALLISSCDLFNAPARPDYLSKIDEDIAWANAEKLTVRLDYPSAWGTSSPSAGPVTMDIRAGYAFDIEFTPDLAYAFKGWRVYETSSLSTAALGGDWRVVETLLDSVPMLSDWVIPPYTPRGGKNSFTLHNTVPVTLVPWCVTEPYVIRTEPRDNPQGLWPLRQPIVIHFNGSLHDNMEWDKEWEAGTAEIIKITNASTGAVINNYFLPPVYISRPGSHTVTITPKTDTPPPPDLEIEMIVGPNIRNIFLNNMLSTIERVRWKTTGEDMPTGTINTWNAEYRENNNDILVNWTFSMDGSATGVVRASLKGGFGTITEQPGGASSIITGVGKINDSNITQNQSVTGVQEYTIILELDSGGIIVNQREIKVWNIPGMKVEMSAGTPVQSNTVHLTQANYTTALTATNSSGKNFVLTENITLNNGWRPVGDAATKFQGKFYGNGNTITIAGIFIYAGVTYAGIFGYVQDAEIRDLTVQINRGSNSTTVSHVGGIIGYAGGNTKISNCIVRGTYLNTSSSSSMQFVGGIAGIIESKVIINKAYSSAPVNISGNTTMMLYLGGAVGKIGVGTDDNTPNALDVVAPNTVILSNITVTGYVMGISQSNSNIYIGGIVGLSRSIGGEMHNLSYSGTMSAYRNTSTRTGIINVGGIVGYCDNPNIFNCVFEQSGQIRCTDDNSTTANIGGITGNMKNIVNDNNNWLNSCIARGDIEIRSKAETLNAGGVVGNYIGNGDLYFYSNVYERGRIFVQTGYGKLTNVGGVIGNGASYGMASSNYSRAALIEVDVGSGDLNFGGYCGSITDFDSSDECGNSSPIKMSELGQPTSGNVNMGGLGGFAKGISFGDCWSIGAVSSRGAGLQQSTGGLFGRLEGGASISSSWGEGSVTAVNSYHGSSDTVINGFNTGGLVGSSINTTIQGTRASGTVVGRRDTISSQPISVGSFSGFISGGSITNCYAEGNILADNPNNSSCELRAGGLVGFMDTGSAINHSYARGSVSAQSAGSGTIFAGGIAGVGITTNQSITSNAALGASVTAKGPGAKNVARIFAYPASITNSVNFAMDTMKILSGNEYYSFPPPNTITGSLVNSGDGLSKTDAEFKKTTTWTNATTVTPQGLGFIADFPWNPSSIEDMGFPKFNY